MTSQFKFDSSSLVDLKAEVFRKTQEAKRNQQIFGRIKGNEEQRFKNNKIWSKTNIGIQIRSASEGPDIPKDVVAILKKKAELYEKLKNPNLFDEEDIEGRELRDRFLVNFTSKENDFEKDGGEENESSDEDWTEYTDPLGRTRVIQKKQLKDLMKRDEDLKRENKVNERKTFDEKGKEGKCSEENIKNSSDYYLSEDSRAELLRQKWAKEEEENLRKKDIHYGDVLYDEARTHGASYYQFSRDASHRLSQKEELDRRHEETLQAQSLAASALKTKEASLQVRLLRVKNRKRAKLGLSPLELDKSESLSSSSSSSSSVDPSLISSWEDSIVKSLKELREQNEGEMTRKSFVREWDLGKEGVISGEKKIISQNEWVWEKRKERRSEFAPLPYFLKDSVDRKKTLQDNYGFVKSSKKNFYSS